MYTHGMSHMYRLEMLYIWVAGTAITAIDDLMIRQMTNILDLYTLTYIASNGTCILI